MHLHITPETSAIRQTAVEVNIWEAYLLRNRTNMSNTLCAYSLDNGPWHETDDGRLIFRFTAFDWFNNIRQLLVRDHIHCDLVRHFPMQPLPHCAGKISLVTADADLSASVMSGLESAGYQVKVFPDGTAMLEKRFAPVNLLLIDRHNADANALKICRQVRADPATKDIPVILLCEKGMKSREALLAGATDYIEKPFHIHYLLNVVARYTRNEH